MNAKIVLKMFMMYVNLHGIILVLNHYVLIPVPMTVLTKYLMPQHGKVIVQYVINMFQIHSYIFVNYVLWIH